MNIVKVWTAFLCFPHLAKTSSLSSLISEQLPLNLPLMKQAQRSLTFLLEAHQSHSSKAISSVYCKHQIKVKCTACNRSKHNLAYCQSFKAKSLSGKRNFVMEQGLCFNCLKVKHTSKQCPSPNCYLKCGKRHHTFLHLNDSRDAVNQDTSETVRQDTLKHCN